MLTPAVGEVPSVMAEDRARAALVGALQRPRYEVLPLAGHRRPGAASTCRRTSRLR
ncbi:MAG: hypothetical protein WKF73_08825 [Nocardioidaceae bacterium]